LLLLLLLLLLLTRGIPRLHDWRAGLLLLHGTDARLPHWVAVAARRLRIRRLLKLVIRGSLLLLRLLLLLGSLLLLLLLLLLRGALPLAASRGRGRFVIVGAGVASVLRRRAALLPQPLLANP
jgi:hypothetical protein